VKRPPSLPTWLVAALTALVLGGAGALFYVGAHHPSSKRPSTANGDPSSDSLLKLPTTSTGPTDDRRRGAIGRDRLTVPANLGSTTDGATAAALRLDALRGTRVTLLAADAGAPSVRTPSATTKVGTVAVPCAPKTTSTAARTTERLVLDALQAELQAAGAIVTRLDDSSGVAPCSALRVAQFERSDFSLVVASSDTIDAGQVIAPARPAGTLTTADTATAARLVGALAASTKVAGSSTGDSALASLLASFAVLDLPGGGSTAWIVTPAGTDSAAFAHAVALGLASVVAPATSSTPASDPTAPEGAGSRDAATSTAPAP
jgi:hypothetical protein